MGNNFDNLRALGADDETDFEDAEEMPPGLREVIEAVGQSNAAIADAASKIAALMARESKAPVVNVAAPAAPKVTVQPAQARGWRFVFQRDAGGFIEEITATPLT